MKVAFRTDASMAIGTGHLMRCLTLADALKKRGAEVRFLMRHLPDTLEPLIQARGHELIRLEGSGENGAFEGEDLAHAHWLGASQQQDADQVLKHLSGARWNWVMVDHYALDHQWESRMRQKADRILVIDDLADRRHECDLLLDQNLFMDMEARYLDKVPPTAKLLLGPKYALLRPEFAAMRRQVSLRVGPVRRILVFFGGVDADNHTGRALDVLSGLGPGRPAVEVVIGSGHPNREEIIRRCGEQGFECHVQTERMAELMAGADLSIGAAGSATWERCCLGLPALAVPVAANQAELLEVAASHGLVWATRGPEDARSDFERDLGALLDNGPLRAHMSRVAFETVDGRGAQRVASALGSPGLRIRPATLAECRELYEWRNHPSIRRVSRDSREIDWETHQKWMAAVLQSPQRDLLIGSDGEVDIGVVRFDVQGEKAEVSIYLAPEVRSPWSGRDLLLSAEEWFVGKRPEVRQIVAEVLGGNLISTRLFLGSGYRPDSMVYIKELS